MISKERGQAHYLQFNRIFFARHKKQPLSVHPHPRPFLPLQQHLWAWALLPHAGEGSLGSLDVWLEISVLLLIGDHVRKVHFYGQEPL
jgi:hypothetical protein